MINVVPDNTIDYLKSLEYLQEKQPSLIASKKDENGNLLPNEQSKKAAQDAINGWDPTYGCIYYFNPSTATSKWIWSRPQVLTIGRHIFCK